MVSLQFVRSASEYTMCMPLRLSLCLSLRLSLHLSLSLSTQVLMHMSGLTSRQRGETGIYRHTCRH